MGNNIHILLSLAVLSAMDALIYFQSISVIGFLHGPSAQIEAQNIYEFTNTFLNEPTCDAYDTAYQDVSFLRDAGMIASLFTIILIALPGFLSYNLTKGQCASVMLLLPSLWISPGLIGQILSARVPIELSFFERFGIDGISAVGKCSLHSLALGRGLTSTFVEVVLDEMKLVGFAAGILFLIVGIMPVEK